MVQKLHFYWLDDDTLLIRDAAGKELERIIISELPCKIPGFNMGKHTDSNGCVVYHMEYNREPGIASRKDIEESLSCYFSNHDIHSYDNYDLWFEVLAGNLCGFGGQHVDDLL